jgi:hypothetical protein
MALPFIRPTSSATFSRKREKGAPLSRLRERAGVRGL